MTLSSKIYLCQGDDGFFWVLESQGRVTAQSGVCYTRKHSCEKAIASVKASMAMAEVIDWVKNGFEFEPLREHVNQETRRWIFAADNGICHLCNEPVDPFDWHLDHVVPHSLGGPTSIENLRVAHPRCNTSKGTQIVGTNSFDPWRRGPWPVL